MKMIIYTNCQSNRILEIARDIREIRIPIKFLWVVLKLKSEWFRTIIIYYFYQ